MARKLRNTPRRRKAPGHASSRDRAAKDEKARYERCRRRRWGLVKKASEYNVLFGSEVFMLLKDGQKSWYFSSNDGWTSTPQDMSGAVRVFAPGHVDTKPRQDDSGASDTSSDSGIESPNIGELQAVHAEFVSRLEALRTLFQTVVGSFKNRDPGPDINGCLGEAIVLV